ncbi:MAG: PAS domain-containing protein [Gammaproteobacteria bacterium]|nr:PAS domain-containing protein [Gammaproteobacteria bacterium]
MDKDVKEILDSLTREIKEIRNEKEKLKNNYEDEIYKLNRIFNSLPASVYWKDLDGVYRGQNKFSRDKMRSVGLEQEMIGKTDHDLFPKEAADEYRKNDLEVIKIEREFSKEEVVILPNGETIVQVSSKKPLYDKDGSVCGIIGNTVDITELKEIESELKEAKNKAEIADIIKTDFIHNMEHDIRTPLSGLWGVTHLLEKKETDKSKKELLRQAAEAAKELLDYCNDILNFSKIKSGKLPVFEKKFDLKKMVEHIAKLEQPSADTKKIKLQIDYAKKMPEIIIGDEFRLSKILLNLVGNAIKFTQKGSVKISVKQGKAFNNRHFILILTVKDTGIGIPAEKQDLIYEKFVRGTPSNKGLFNGAGLGLNIIKQFISELDADIDVTSKEESGTVFTCSIPVKLPLLNE